VLLSFDEAARFCRAEIIALGGEGSANPAALSRHGFESVCIDSREVLPGGLFIALNGLNVDGHRFVEAAFKAGAAGALVAKTKVSDFDLEKIARASGSCLLAVDDTLRGLQDVAAGYVSKFPNLLRIGITGSSGKTTTKEMCAAMLGIEKNVVCNAGNLNSETGLPLSVFAIRAEHEVGVFEMGMNRHGEIAELASVLKPHIACITNVGSAHIGCIGSLEKIADEKKSIFSQFSGSEIAVLPEDGAYKDFLCKGINGTVLYFGEKQFCATGGVVENLGLRGSNIIWQGKGALCPLPGAHNVKNALAAACIAKAAGASDDAVRKGLETVKPLFGRSQAIKAHVAGLPFATRVFCDCYNANPDSLAGAIALCDAVEMPEAMSAAGSETMPAADSKEMSAGKKIYCVGSMLELGTESRAAHENAGKLLAASKADFIFLFGEETKDAAKMLAAKKYVWTNDIEELKKKLSETLGSGDLLLLKGSRGCALERVLTGEG
jgi:UDP-N-acetylmuramoyl-tripeptide--D-alanyl-D-alanine ligase